MITQFTIKKNVVQVVKILAIKTGISLLCIINTMAADVLVTQGARALAAMVLIYFPQYIMFSAPER